VKLLFAAEKEICHQILDGVEPFRDQSFAEITTISFGMLLSFGYAIAISRRSPEKVFVILDMYEIMIELQPEVTCTVSYNTASSYIAYMGKCKRKTIENIFWCIQPNFYS